MKKQLYGNQYRPLSKEQVGKIHTKSLRILEDVGLAFEPALVELLNSISREGLKIDYNAGRIRFSPTLVNQILDRVPDRVILYSRDGQRNLELYEDNVYFATGGTAVNVLDIDSGKCRTSTLKDFYQIARLEEKLSNIDITFRTVTPQDISLDITDINLLYAKAKATTKHINLGIFKKENLPQVYEMAVMIAGSENKLINKPWLSIHATGVVSPLKLDTDPIQIMAQAVQYGLPVTLSTAPMTGSTGPITLAGNLVLMHSELMAMIVIAQLIKPGTPVIYCGTPATADMASMNFIAGTVESAMMMSSSHQLARQIGVPNCISAGWTDAKIPDAQAGWEAATTLLLASMAGGNCIRHAAGVLDSAMTVAFEQYVISNEIIGIARRLLQGIDTSDEHIAYDVIKEAGPGGQYITSQHTFKHMRSELFAGHGVTNRKNREQWESAGSLDARQEARNIAKQILSESPTPCIDFDLDELIRSKFDIRL